MKEKSTETRDYTTGRAARELRVSPAHVRALCQAGLIAARATRGGHWRIPRDEVQRLRREGLPEPPPATPAEPQLEAPIVPATNLPHRHPALLAEPSKDAIASADEVVRLENEVKSLGLKRTKEENLDWFRERQRKQAEAKAAHDRLLLESKAERLRREWLNNCLAYALDCIPDDAPEDARLSVAESARAVLAGLSPSDPEEVTEPLIGAAVEKGLRPWQRSKEIERVAQEAQTVLPYYARGFSGSLSEWELCAMRAARDAIVQLGNDATLAEMRATAIEAAREVARQYHDWDTKRAIVASIFLQMPVEQERARQNVRAALEKVLAGTGRAEMERIRDEIMVPFKAAEETARAQARAASQADLYLLHLDSYLETIAADRGLRDFSERYQVAQDLKKEIRPILIEEILAEPFSLDEAYTFIKSLADRRLQNRS